MLAGVSAELPMFSQESAYDEATEASATWNAAKLAGHMSVEVQLSLDFLRPAEIRLVYATARFNL